LTDFQTLLKQSIVARGIREASRRQGVYAQARSALIRQLAEAHPRLANADIAKRVVEFDRAMKQIESELAVELAPEETLSEAPEDISDPAGDDGAEGEQAANGWDAHDDPIAGDASLEADGAARSTNGWDDRDSRGGAVAIRGAASPTLYAEYEDELPPPVPFTGRWKDEEAVYREEKPGAPPPLVVRPRLPPPQRRLGWTLSEGDKVRVLVGAIGALGLVLLGLLIFLFLPGRDGAVTVPLGRGTVSDAASADRIAGAALDVKQSFVVFDGRDPTVFQASSDNPIRLDSDAEGAFARIGTSTASGGVKVQIGPGLASRLAGQNIRVVMTMRAATERGALNMRFAYQSGVALSHWQTANLSRTYASSGMTWIVPQMRTSANGADYLIIEPGIPGDGTYADIQSIRIDLLGSAPTS
jgi:hypothetical protein